MKNFLQKLNFPQVALHSFSFGKLCIFAQLMATSQRFYGQWRTQKFEICPGRDKSPELTIK